MRRARTSDLACDQMCQLPAFWSYTARSEAKSRTLAGYGLRLSICSPSMDATSGTGLVHSPAFMLHGLTRWRFGSILLLNGLFGAELSEASKNCVRKSMPLRSSITNLPLPLPGLPAPILYSKSYSDFVKEFPGHNTRSAFPAIATNSLCRVLPFQSLEPIQYHSSGVSTISPDHQHPHMAHTRWLGMTV